MLKIIHVKIFVVLFIEYFARYNLPTASLLTIYQKQ